ncbi:tubulin polyglutamylase complex subunit 1-like isoform X2 [Corticium candelabrum]|uniref:tubulin polyglutamylase complex subunit 1-like isoform X2 n=1 Tax=Corticium candelabrum TaxID=121492 RepID=UPI002E25DAB6|nr:tubulin polyglutamylase complex subunit 1-like isoform X2 [Corticium candelabrum]
MQRSRTQKRQVPTLSDEKQDPEDYLKKLGVTRHVHHALTQLLESRSDDPVGFLVTYFSQVVERPSVVKRAQQEIGLVHHASPGFQQHVFNAYTIMCSQATVKAGGHRGSKHPGLMGGPFSELLQLLLTSVPTVFANKLMTKIQCRVHEAVHYSIFCRGVLSCLVLEDFLQHSKSLYEMLDIFHEGAADRHLCDAVLQQLTLQIDSASTNHDTTIQKRTTNCIRTAMKQVEQKRTGKNVMPQDEFTATAVDALLDKIREIK